MNTIQKEKTQKLYNYVKKLYAKHKDKLLFHWWHHINFVTKKSIIFAQDLKANRFLVQSSAIIHDLNYIYQVDIWDKKDILEKEKILKIFSYTDDEIKLINDIIYSASTENRYSDICLEAKALSDADAVFKVLPTTPILFASKYLEENNTSLKKLAHKIVSEQKKLLELNIYFYSNLWKEKYLHLAENQIKLWENIESTLEDEDVLEILEIANDNWILNVKI